MWPLCGREQELGAVQQTPLLHYDFLRGLCFMCFFVAKLRFVLCGGEPVFKQDGPSIVIAPITTNFQVPA